MNEKRVRWLATVWRRAWYVWATILLLSIPTFSNLLPQFSISFELPSILVKKAAEEPSPPLRVETELHEGKFSAAVEQRPGATGSSVQPSPLSRSAVSQRGLTVGTHLEARDPFEYAEDGFPPDGLELPNDKASGFLAKAFQESELAVELSRMEEDYALALSGFSGHASSGGPVPRNPFGDELAARGSMGGGTGETQQTPGPDPSPSGGGASSEPPPADPGPGPATGQGTGGANPDQAPPRPRFSFLIIGHFNEIPGKLYFRSYLDSNGDLVTEEGLRIGFYTYLIGVPGQFLVASQNSNLMTADLDQDGLLDAVTATPEYFGTALTIAFQEGIGAFRVSQQLFLPYLVVQGMAPFDFDDDGNLELAVIGRRSSTITVLRLTGDSYTHSEEISLPFEPAVLAGTVSRGGYPQRFLHLLDSDLRQSLVIGSQTPGLVSYGNPPTLRRMRKVSLEGATEQLPGVDYRILEYEDRIVVLKQGIGRIDALASLDKSERVPFAVLGDYFGEGRVHLIVVP